MAAVFSLPEQWRENGRGRVLAFVLVLLIHIGLAVLVLTIAPNVKLAKMGINAVEAFNILAPKAEQTEEAAPPPPQPTAPQQPRPAPRAAPPTIYAPAPPIDLGVLPLEFDIRKVPNANVAPEAAPQAQANAPDSAVVRNPFAAVYGPTLGPSRPSPLAGKTLYAAEWYREPTNAELAFYLPKTGVPAGAWALVACRTVANFRVEDCQEMGDSRPGSGLSRAIRNAAWQFRVRPPRVDGDYKVGEWVQIRIDFTAPPASGEDA
jgi:protein TonB